MTNDKFVKFMEPYFNIYNGDTDLELEIWTEGGVNMHITIHKENEGSYMDQYLAYISNFSVDDEVEVHRYDKDYREDFPCVSH